MRLLTTTVAVLALSASAVFGQTEQPTAPAPEASAAQIPAEAPAPATDQPAAPPAAEAAPPAEAGPPAPTTVAPAPAPTVGSIVAPPEGKGQVVFYRPSRLAGMALSFSVHEGEKGIGKLGNGSYFIEVTDPGAHTYTIQSEVTDKLTLEVDAGETYFVQQTIGMGIMMGRPHLSPSDSAAFEKAKVKLSTKTPTDLKPKT